MLCCGHFNADPDPHPGFFNVKTKLTKKIEREKKVLVKLWYVFYCFCCDAGLVPHLLSGPDPNNSNQRIKNNEDPDSQ